MVFFKVALAQLHYCTAREVYAWISGRWFALYKWLPPRCDKSAHLDGEALSATATIAGVRGARTVGGGRSAVRPAPAGGELWWRAHRARPARASLYVYKIYRGLFPRYIVWYIVNYIYVPACILFVLVPCSEC